MILIDNGYSVMILFYFCIVMFNSVQKIRTTIYNGTQYVADVKRCYENWETLQIRDCLLSDYRTGQDIETDTS